MFSQCRPKSMFLVICLILGLLILPGDIAKAGGDQDSGVLDGKVFAGTMGQASVFSGDDKVYFSDGKFWSDICIRCGYKPGNYWTRSTPEGIQFQGEVNNGSGTFIYSGQIKNGRATVEINWSKKRWYWTSSRKLTFDGIDKDAEISYPSSKAARIATEALANGLPPHCW